MKGVVLVTGGAGFIGSNFIRWILQHDDEVTVVNVDKLTYAGNLENLTTVSTSPRHQFVRGDISDAETIGRIWQEHNIEAVVHFAAETHVDRSIVDSSDFVKTNVLGTQVLLEAARRNGVGRFLQVSTDEVYGSLGPVGKFTEESPLHPNSPYAASKASSDLLALAYHRTYGFPLVVTRCSNNYGPYQFPEKLIPLMILNAMADRHLPVYGDGGNVRDWLHVDDHCAALHAVLTRGRDGEVYNIGGNHEWKNIDVVRLILRHMGKPESLIRFVKDRPAHDRRYAIEARKIMTELHWSPVHEFEQGLKETIEWYAKNTQWTHNVTSGDYRRYYGAMYDQQ